MITVTAARKVAKRARQHGYYATGHQVYSAIYVHCPECRREVHVEPLWRQGETHVQALDRAMLDHLRSPYDDERCPGARD